SSPEGGLHAAVRLMARWASELGAQFDTPHARRRDACVGQAEWICRVVDAGDIALVEQVGDKHADAPMVARCIPVQPHVDALLRGADGEIGTDLAGALESRTGVAARLAAKAIGGVVDQAAVEYIRHGIAEGGGTGEERCAGRL